MPSMRIHYIFFISVAGIGSRADRTTIRDNYIEDASGSGVRLGGSLVDGYQYGVDNQVCVRWNSVDKAP